MSVAPAVGLDIESAIPFSPARGLDIMPPPAKGLDAESIKVTMLDGPAKPGLFKQYIFSSRENALTGPFYSDFTSVAAKENSGQLFAVDKNNKLHKTDLLDLNSTDFSPAPENIWDDMDLSFSPNKTTGVVASKKGSFHYRSKFIEGPFKKFGTVGPGHSDLYDPIYFRDAYLAISETHWMHFGSEASEKDVYRVDLTFHTNSFGHLWLYIKNETGQVSGQYKGELSENMKVFTNLRGRRFKIQMFVATHLDYSWAMREMAVGYNLGKSF